MLFGYGDRGYQFGMFDNGGDLVETAFLMQGLLAARQYVSQPVNADRDLAARITHLWQTVEWDWYSRETGDNALIWHWSPQWSWRTDHKLTGFNETMIAYLLAMASPTHGIPADAYYAGWAAQSRDAALYRVAWSGTADGEHYANGHTYEGVKLDVGVGNGGPLFFTQYSFMGAEPRQIAIGFEIFALDIDMGDAPVPAHHDLVARADHLARQLLALVLLVLYAILHRGKES